MNFKLQLITIAQYNIEWGIWPSLKRSSIWLVPGNIAIWRNMKIQRDMIKG
jgi:hypothetical protein